MRLPSRLVALSVTAFTVALLGATIGACTARGEGPGFGPPPPESIASDASAPPPCTGLACQRVTCSGKTTSISGVVRDPAGKNPLYNVIVYVPNAPLEPLGEGIRCDRCGALTSGDPIVTTLTRADGSFTLDNVPIGADIPLVMQMGKWRRMVKLPKVEACVDNVIDDKSLTRLPRSRAEGDIPRIAVATGGWDQFECLLRKIGIDETEFTSSTSASGDGRGGRVHLFKGRGGAHAGPGTANADTLWADPKALASYDVLINACEGAAFEDDKPQSSRQNVFDYVNAGGRMFATHYQYYWIAQGPAPFPATGVWDVGNYDMPEPTVGKIETSFPKGEAFAEWLANVGASKTKGTLELVDVRRDLNQSVAPTQTWISAQTTGGLSAVQHVTFNTPIGKAPDDQCGRVVFSDFRVTKGAGEQFPKGCMDEPMTAQEKALEFMLFDLTACILDDQAAPTAPPPR